MSIAIDTNVLVRFLVRDDEAQFAAAQRLVDEAATEDEPVLILLGVLLETEWVLRSRYRIDRASIACAFTGLLEASDVALENPTIVEETLYVWAHHPQADFADCLFAAHAVNLGRTRFLTFDLAAARLPGGELLA